jgi:N-acetyl-anhydromuramyl-L-alanine amidase AmpD
MPYSLRISLFLGRERHEIHYPIDLFFCSYRQKHYGIEQSSPVIVPKMIVLHWTESAPSLKVFNLFYPAFLRDRPDIRAQSSLNVSAQFLVDRDGTIYQLMPSNWMARHVIGLNNTAIGIENVGGVQNKEDLTKAQVIADVALVRQLVQQYPTIHYLIGHYEYGQFKDSSLWQEKNTHYITKKQDPGSKFMREIRAKVVDLNLASHP